MSDSHQQALYTELLIQLKAQFQSAGTDKEAFHYVHQFMNLLVYPLYGYPDNESLGRADSRCKDITTIFKESGVRVQEGLALVDIGCSQGSITKALGESMGVAPCNVYGVDVLPVEKVLHADGFTYVRVAEEGVVALPFSDASVGVVVMLMSLHHIKDAEGYLAEVARILAPGGALIIKEHDVDSDTFVEAADALDVLHGLYSISWSRVGCQEDATFPDNFYAKYRSRDQWANLAMQNSLERVSVPDVNKWWTMSDDCHRDYRKPHGNFRNATFSFWAMFVKP